MSESAQIEPTEHDKLLVKASPEKSTLQLGPGEHALGSMVTLDVPIKGEFRGDLHKRPPYENRTNTGQADLAGDIFWNMYDGELPDANPVPLERTVNKKLLDWMRKSPAFEEAIADTRDNIPAAVASSQLLYQHLTREDVVHEALQEQEWAEETAAATAGHEALSKAYEAMGDLMEADTESAIAEMGQSALKDKTERALAKLDSLDDDPAMQAAVSNAIRKGAEKGKEVRQIASGFGFGSGAGQNVYDSPEEALDFLKFANFEIQRIAEIAGRLRGFALSETRERVQSGPVAQDVGLTSNIMRIFESERAYLSAAAPAYLRATKVAELVDNGLMGWTPSEDHDTDGDIVIAVDFSPSMHGDILTMAKGIALGLAQAKKAKGRAYHMFNFASDKSAIVDVTSSDGWREHINWASAKTRGGTDFNMALVHALESLENMPNWHNSDIVFISDGEGQVSDHMLAVYRKVSDHLGCRLFYVHCAATEHSTMEELFESRYFNITEIAYEIFDGREFTEETGKEVVRDLITRW